MRRRLTVPAANAMTANLSQRLTSARGPAHVTGGDNVPQHFAESALSAFKEEWQFGDYGATLSAVRLADTGLMVREQYISPVP